MPGFLTRGLVSRLIRRALRGGNTPRTRCCVPQAYGSSDPAAPAVPRATFAAHPSLRVGWRQYGEVLGVGITSSRCGVGMGRTLLPGTCADLLPAIANRPAQTPLSPVSFPRKRESLFAGVTPSAVAEATSPTEIPACAGMTRWSNAIRNPPPVDGQSLGMLLVAEGLAHVWGGGKRSWC